MNNKILFLLLGIFLISFSIADPVYKIDEQSNLTVTCINDGFCSNDSFCTINVIGPSGLVVVEGRNMTDQGTFFNYTIIPSIIGTYDVEGFCTDDSKTKEVDYDFKVTVSGTLLSTGQATLYFLFALGAIALFGFCLYWVFELPSGNNVTKDGDIVSMNDWKYLRIFLIPVCYVLLLWEFGIMRSIFANFLILDGPHLFFNWGYLIMLAGAFPLTIVGLWFFFLTIILDKRIIKSLKEGRPVINDKGR